MGLDLNLIKTGINTLSRRATTSAQDGTKVIQLAKNSRLRELGFSEMTQSAEGWSLRGDNISEWFSIGEIERLQEFIRKNTTGTKVRKDGNYTEVIFGSGNEAVKNSFWEGFYRIKDKLGFCVNDYQGMHIASENFREWITIPINSSKSKIQEILFKLMQKRLPKQKWSLQEFDRRIVEDFSEEMIKPVHDYIEGNLAKEELIKLIRRHKKYTTLDIIPSKTEQIIGDLYGTKPIEYIPKNKLLSFGIEDPVIKNYWSDVNLLWLYEEARNEPEFSYVLKEFFEAMGKKSISSSLYRFIGKSEYEKLISGDIVKTRAGYNQGIRFDVTPKPTGYKGDYRIKLNVEASPETMNGNPINWQKPEENYYHWYTPQYDIKDIKSIVDWRNKKIVYESDEEILSNFIDGYISKLG